nr:MAG TPA: hypothetical protein [Caudoviricetes sp.]
MGGENRYVFFYSPIFYLALAFCVFAGLNLDFALVVNVRGICIN